MYNYNSRIVVDANNFPPQYKGRFQIKLGSVPFKKTIGCRPAQDRYYSLFVYLFIYENGFRLIYFNQIRHMKI